MGTQYLGFLGGGLHAITSLILRKRILTLILYTVDKITTQKYGSWVRSKSKYARNDGMPLAAVPPQNRPMREKMSHPRASDMAGNMV